ncbi:DUF1254 domain-containing protein [Pararobbsia silviterrae]|uniref:DUF1254 domain-containing protein n=1 Tax=Pararobbsia silviterrae TaxID=1792498 RepID=UPI001F0C2763|nr:DUF1254 domain-containing protein [Pararobbsia silviterrae]
MSVAAHAQSVSVEQARAIARDATIYGFPLVDNYRIQYAYFVDRNNADFKAPWNTLASTARVFTPEDKAIQTPNSDTPYSFLGADLRAEPLVLTVPKIEKARYYSLQFIDAYTFNFAYVGTRTTGNGAGRYLLAGPGWHGKVPRGITAVIRSDTQFAFVLYRTQLFSPDDIDRVKRIQASYRVEPLSAYIGQHTSAATQPSDFIEPLTSEQERSSLRFFDVLNFVLRYCPNDPSETALMARFAQIGIVPGKPFDSNALSPEMRKALEDGMSDAWTEFADFKKTELDTGKLSSADGFGDRAFLNNNYMARMASAVLGIYGNSKAEAVYPAYFVDADGQKLEGAHRYTIRFAPGQLPPVNAFWSLTLYELPSSLLYANVLNRYLINSSNLPTLKRDADGGITLYVQHDSPGAALESNWLPAPDGAFFSIMRLYWPKPSVLEGEWNAPKMLRAQ